MDPTDLGPGTATWLGGTGTVLLGAFLWLRKFLSKDAADRAMDNADIGTVRRLNELLDSEREARKVEREARIQAEARADQFAKERNELAAAVGRMEGRIDALTSQVAQLTDKVTSQSQEISRLRTQLGGNA
jgi:predicted nuclease with TOPRIM domain